MDSHTVIKWLQALAVSTAAIFIPIKTLLACTLVLVIADTFSGMAAAYKRGEKLTSAGLRRSVTKIFVYEISICVGYLAEKYMNIGIPVVNLISTAISAVEVKSILENLEAVNGSNFLKAIIGKLGSTNDTPAKE